MLPNRRLVLSCCGRSLRHLRHYVTLRSMFQYVVMLSVPCGLFTAMTLATAPTTAPTTATTGSSTNNDPYHFLQPTLCATTAMFFCLEYLVKDRDAMHMYNETINILFGPCLSFFLVLILHYGKKNQLFFFVAFYRPDICHHLLNQHPLFFSSLLDLFLTGGLDKDIKCFRLVLMFGSCCVCYVQSVTLLQILHATYVSTLCEPPPNAQRFAFSHVHVLWLFHAPTSFSPHHHHGRHSNISNI